MNPTQRYKETGNSVCGTPPDTDTGLTREEEKEVIRESLFVLAQTGEPSSLSIAELSVIHADALISELSKGTES